MKNMEVIGGLVAGTFIGTAIGLLFAPDEGSATRRKIMSEADRRADNILEENLGKNNK
jgi:gas vesicle protein